MTRRLLLPVAVLGLVWAHMTGAFHWNCPTRVLFHVPCPTCGMTTAARALLHLDFVAATRAHPLALVVIPFVALLSAVEIASYVRSGRLGTCTERKAVRIAGLAMCTALFVVWVARFLGAFGGPDS